MFKRAVISSALVAAMSVSAALAEPLTSQLSTQADDQDGALLVGPAASALGGISAGALAAGGAVLLGGILLFNGANDDDDDDDGGSTPGT